MHSSTVTFSAIFSATLAIFLPSTLTSAYATMPSLPFRKQLSYIGGDMLASLSVYCVAHKPKQPGRQRTLFKKPTPVNILAIYDQCLNVQEHAQADDEVCPGNPNVAGVA
ncbi:hypothetical protein BD779DRAFT_1478741 [Infundibulicybe gibba]|nr:hypothetical protein BD779DRAFT_1478741 [Infundibulicybe gibba]